ncbi:hypothetical protein [Methylovulum miyakonense]|uniref:hypothetical protein n=1 Tax=Methylovulum miyakonense TaxID=645578 RepID=UPI000364AC02|nr:hypothetical protein [Methylovulum miyakonense]
MNNEVFESFLTSYEIGVLTQTPHKRVLERACETFLAANIDPNQFWYDQECPPRKVLSLTKPLAIIALNHEWYSDKARAAVLDVFATWERNVLD